MTGERIAAAEVIVSSPGRNYVIVKVTTASGVVGWGDATLNGREMAVHAYLDAHMLPLLVGRDPHRIEDTWQYLYRGAYWRGGPVGMAAISGVDMALWDIKAKIAGLPLYQLLGGRSRDTVRTYCHATGRDLPELLDGVRAAIERGFGAVRIQAGVPGLGQVYGIPDGDSQRYEPATAGARPTEERWDSSAYLRSAPVMFEVVRQEFGDALDVIHDVHHRLTPIEGARLAASLERFHPFWLEDVTPAESPDAFRLVRRASTVPLALGEVFTSVHEWTTLLQERLVDFVRSSATHAGGITGLRRILTLAEVYGARSALHGPSDVSPVGMAAALHLDAAIHNFGIQEYMQHPDGAEEVFTHRHVWSDGAFHLDDAPGLGVEVDEQRARALPYRAASLPVARLLDGTMHDW